MKKIFFLLLIVKGSLLFGSDTLRTYYGDRILPEDTFRTLNFFINIIYDSCPTSLLNP